jgi:peptide/nickel transport system permease protein
MAAVPVVVVPPSKLMRAAGMLRRSRRLPLLPLLIILLVLIAGIFADWAAPHDPRVGILSERNTPPAWTADGTSAHLLGTDQQGRDMLSRIIHGARVSLLVAAVTLVTGGTVGVVLGLLAGWYGGWVDEIIMRMVDILLALPLILVALVMVVSLGQSLSVILIVLAIWIWPRFARMVRGDVLHLRTMDYIALAKVSGASTFRILTVHLFPGVINTLIIVATLQVGIVILVESTLSFLGAGVPPPTPAWGSMVSEGRDKLALAWWISTLPGVAIMLTVMALNLFGDWLRDTLDPRLRQLE